MSTPFANIAEFYNRKVDQFGHDPRACDYGRAESQRRKFELLAEATDYTGLSVLDVGCGFADYATFLQERFEGVRYSGIDLSPAMISRAQAVHPELDLRVGNILEEHGGETYDIVSANGIFYLLGENAPTLMRQLVQEMFRRCRHGVTFNSLSTWAKHQEPGEFYANPVEVVAWCREISPYVTLRHDRLPHDFTIHLFREATQS